MDTILTASIAVSALYIAVEFAMGLADRLSRPVPSPEPTPTSFETGIPVSKLIEPSPEPIAPSRPKPSTVGAMAIDFSAMNAKELRKECSARGLKWRDIHGKNRHATRAQMLGMLAG